MAAAAGESLTLFVPGRAIAAGSKRAYTRLGKDGRVHAGVDDSSGKSGREWRAAIRLAAGDAMKDRAPLEGPLLLLLNFYMPRPAGHYGTRGLRPAAPGRPTTRPDVLKLARAVEDSLTGIVWRDDSQIVDEVLSKRFADDHGIGVVITVAPIAVALEAALASRLPAASGVLFAELRDDLEDGSR